MDSRYVFDTEEHQTRRDQVGRFARNEIAPYAHEWEEANEFPRELYKKAADAGILGIGYPETVGGTGGDIGHALVAGDELVLQGLSVGTAVGLNSHCIALPPIIRFGTPQQIDKFVRPVLSGEKVSALGISEPGCGSDVANLATRAVREGDHYIINGAKTFITSGCRADFVTTAVRTGGEKHGGISLVVIENDAPGYSVSRKLKKTAGGPATRPSLPSRTARSR